MFKPLRPVFIALCLAATAATQASEADHERALRAVQAGEVLSLPRVLERLGRTHSGQVMEVELEREDGRWVYEIRMLQHDGRLVRLDMDARTGDLLRVKGHREPRR